MSHKEAKINVKLILVGDAGVGKTSIVQRYLHDTYEQNNSPTIGAAYETKVIEIDGSMFDVNIWDTAGQESYRSLLPMFFRAASIVFIVFDVTSQRSFLNVPNWVDDVNGHIDREKNIVFALCANKIDNETIREVTTEEIQDLANKLKITFFETSAMTGSGIKQAFQTTLNEYASKNVKKVVSENEKIELISNENKNNSNCC
ncbi:Ras-related protein RGP1 [Tritrichomonas foetus]|uniref:Ras-related protein RGP1 n=1 Tax=Tritrichomonas foetus TaxID=1144522 RepID=A0A1J4JDR8_9EUKA|nr:Ras-related protein RGP1 [Tritrichomonas foetus]|eukprot:OHS97298.1 Ras-related protein RGP1 [Tritrichomonas foetus]